VDQGENDNQSITMIPPSRIRMAITVAKLTNEFLCSIMSHTHDHMMAGHLGHDEMIRTMKEIYQWPGMNVWIADYVKGCTTSVKKNLSYSYLFPSYPQNKRNKM